VKDGRLEIRWKGFTLPYTIFDKDQRVTHTAITENKRLGEVLSWIKSQQDQARPAPRIKTNSEQTGYQKRGTKPGRRRDFVDSPTVIDRQAQAHANPGATALYRPAPDRASQP
jgi:hypothetical protein